MLSFAKRCIVTHATKKMRSGMNKSLKLNYHNVPVEFSFDRDKKYFLYIHVPYCNEFCSFCSFHKFKYDKRSCKEYFSILRDELRAAKNRGYNFETLYVGGGTPLIDVDELLKTLELAKELFGIKHISTESSPNHIKVEELEKLRGVVDRLSIGVQTFDNETLKSMGRYERYGSCEELQEKISKIAGILPILSLDLIFNLPNQTQKMLKKDLQIAKKLGVEQITTYPLMNSKLIGESFFECFNRVSSSKEFEFYNIIKDELKDYRNNNAWSFSKKESCLSDEYTVSESEYIGLGCGAFTYINNQLHINAYNMNQYKDLIREGMSTIIAGTDKFNLKSSVEYHFLLGLFGGEIDIMEFNENFKVSLEKVLFFELIALRVAGAIKEQDGKIFSTEFGKFLSMILMKEFYMGMDKVRGILKNKFL